MTAPQPPLDYLDQASLELATVTGRGQLMQCVWVYDHPLDFEGVERFHRNFAASLGNRLIERSPLPFGRHRWVRPAGLPSPLRVAQSPRPREELMQWADELANLPIDPVHGPAWHVAVQPLTDGSTAVSMIGSHVIGDGVGALLAIYEAIAGSIRTVTYQQAGYRRRGQALAADLRQAGRDLPHAARTAVAAAKAFRAKRNHDKGTPGSTPEAQPEPGDDRPVTVPSVAIYVGIPEWDARAAALHGNSYSLLAGFAAKLGERLGRQRPDGEVTLIIAINLRESLDDDRALAMAFANAAIDPSTVCTDLSEARAAVRIAREKAKNEPDPTIGFLAVVPWLPRRAVKGLADMLFAYSEDRPVSCSNLGDLPPELARLDGTPAEYVFIRAVDTNVTLGELKRSHGQLVVVSGRINGTVSISVEAYQLGVHNTTERLREIAGQTLAEFGLAGVID